MQNVKVRTGRQDSDGYGGSARTVMYPTRCPACGRSEVISDKQDPEATMERRFLKCLTSTDPTCKTAVASPSMQVLKDRLSSTDNS